jgi:hypothetical protein
MAEANNLYEKLRKVQVELKAPKSQYNSFAKYYYRNVEDIMEAVKPLCEKHGLTLVISDSIELIGDHFYVKASAEVYDGSNSMAAYGYARESEERKGMDSSQLTGSTSSYARKYALGGLFLVDDNKDADSHDNSSQGVQKAEKAVVAKLEGNPDELASDIQRKQIQAFMTALGVATEDIPGVLATDYHVKGKLTKKEAVRVLSEMK